MTDIDLIAALCAVRSITREQFDALPPTVCKHLTAGWCEPCQAGIDQAAHQHDPDRERVFTRRPRLRRSA